MFKTIKSDAVTERTPFSVLDMNADFYNTNDEYKSGVDVIIQSFMMSLSVRKRTRWWRPEFGVVRLYELLFEPYDSETADELATVIQMMGDSVSNGNNSLTVSRVHVRMSEQQVYHVTMTLEIDGFDSVPPVTFGLAKL